jgi:hypothetical protein
MCGRGIKKIPLTCSFDPSALAENGSLAKLVFQPNGAPTQAIAAMFHEAGTAREPLSVRHPPDNAAELTAS